MTGSLLSLFARRDSLEGLLVGSDLLELAIEGHQEGSLFGALLEFHCDDARSRTDSHASASPWQRREGRSRPHPADAAVTAYATYYNFHRLSGALGWRTPAERFDGTPFTDRGFEHVPALAPIADLLAELMATAA
jgi:hypothetical protein